MNNQNDWRYELKFIIRVVFFMILVALLCVACSYALDWFAHLVGGYSPFRGFARILGY